MKENVLQRWDYLHLLANFKTKKRRNALVDAAKKDEIHAITEIVKNCLAGNVPLQQKCLNQMRRHKCNLRLLSRWNHPHLGKEENYTPNGRIVVSVNPSRCVNGRVSSRKSCQEKVK